MGILDKINKPQDIKTFGIKKLNDLATEVRNFLIKNVSQTGGHLASSLGTVELTIALHYVLNTPDDKIVWDVGHQAYTHKLLTGRREDFSTLRQYGGISGFPRGSESEYDSFDAGHASNSISAALGYACARDINGEKNSVVAVIGDGAMGGGLAFEGINNAARLKTNFIVVLNNNEMSISKNVGGMSHYLNRLRTNPKYVQTKEGVSHTLRKIPVIGNPTFKAISAVKSSFRKMIINSPVFDELGFTCIGPVDGHNIEELIEVLQRAKKINGPVMLHIYTKKGKGYTFAENNPNKFHGIGKFDVKTGETLKKQDNSISPSAVFGKKLSEIARNNKKVVAITAAMPDGTGLKDFANEFPDRFFDVGIAEGHAVTFSGGLSKGGLVPVVAIYSTFLQRAYDHIFHDVVLQKAHVVFALDRAGLVGEDGETHHGIFDISYLSSIPGVAILAPSSASQLEEMLEYAVNSHNGPIAIRYPKVFYSDVESKNNFEFGKAAVLKEGTDITVVAEGSMVSTVLDAANMTNLSVEVIDVRTIKPVDKDTILKSVEKTGKIITVEDNTKSGGLGNIVESAIGRAVTKIAYNDCIVTHGDLKSLYKATGVDARSVADAIERECKA